MTKTSLKRYEILRLSAALGVCRALTVPSSFRYAIEKNLRSIESEVAAIQKGWPEPDLNEPSQAVHKCKEALNGTPKKEANNGELSKADKAELLKKGKELANTATKALEEAKTELDSVIEEHRKWVEDTKEPFDEKVDVDLHIVGVVEINDTVNVPDEMRPRQNQALMQALMPIFKD